MLPYFYIPSFDEGQTEITLGEDNSRHIVQVLRMTPGEQLLLTDGKGTLLTAAITDAHKKKCQVRIQSLTKQPPAKKKVTLAISPLKNASRFEWFLEKATEIGVSTIIPLLCEHTERENTRHDRLLNILISAMLQSQQTRLPDLHPPTAFAQVVANASYDQRFIAHCLEAPRPTDSLAGWLHGHAAATPTRTANWSQLILIGPEGDFSPKEVGTALSEGFLPVALGENRLRTETAGVVAAALLCIG